MHTATKMKKETEDKLKVPDGLTVTIKDQSITVQGKKGEITRIVGDPLVRMKLEGHELHIAAEGETKREKTKVGTWKAHVKNMFKGAESGHHYKLKICSGHFPMNATVSEKEFAVKNFLGEKVPRRVAVRMGVTVKIEGEFVTVESPDKELAGQMAADIEELCKIRGRDTRIFQDGIWITEKDGKTVK